MASASQAKALRRFQAMSVFVGGLFIAAFVSIPIVNLATPLFGTAFMVNRTRWSWRDRAPAPRSVPPSWPACRSRRTLPASPCCCPAFIATL
jgi:CysZ protein